MSHALAFLLVRMDEDDEDGFSQASDWLYSNDEEGQDDFVVSVSRREIAWAREDGMSTYSRDWGFKDRLQDMSPEEAFQYMREYVVSNMINHLSSLMSYKPGWEEPCSTDEWLRRYRNQYQNHIDQLRDHPFYLSMRIDAQASLDKMFYLGYPVGFGTEDDLYTSLGGVFAIDSGPEDFDWNDPNLAIVVLDYYY